MSRNDELLAELAKEPQKDYKWFYVSSFLLFFLVLMVLLWAFLIGVVYV